MVPNIARWWVGCNGPFTGIRPARQARPCTRRGARRPHLHRATHPRPLHAKDGLQLHTYWAVLRGTLARCYSYVYSVLPCICSWRGMVGSGWVWQGVAWSFMARRGWAGHGAARFGEVWRGTAGQGPGKKQGATE